MKSSLLVAALAAASCVHAAEDIRITNPPALLSELGSVGLQEEPALFGIPAYRQTIAGRLVYATPGDMMTGCDPIDKVAANWPSTGIVIAMVDRGECSFVQKVLNAQNAGATAVVVRDNQESGRLPFMIDDGSGITVDIPSVIIKKSVGSTIITYIDLYNNDSAGNLPVTMSMRYFLPEADNKVNWEMWTDSGNKDSAVLKRSFRDAVQALGDNASFEPHYFIEDPLDYTICRTGDICGNQCIASGRYCKTDPEHDITTQLSGSDVLKENLRQLCMWEEVKNDLQQQLKWWSYVSLFEQQCSIDETTWTSECSRRIMGTAGFSGTQINAIEKCYTDANVDGDAGIDLLDAQVTKKRDEGVFYLPTVNINGASYRGDLRCPYPIDIKTCSVLSAICSGYTEGTAPKACDSSPGCHLGQQRDACGNCGGDGNCGGVSAGAVFGIVLLCIIVAGGAVFVYMRRQQTVLRDDIDSLLKQYLPMDEEAAGSLNNNDPDRQGLMVGIEES